MTDESRVLIEIDPDALYDSLETAILIGYRGRTRTAEVWSRRSLTLSFPASRRVRAEG